MISIEVLLYIIIFILVAMYISIIPINKNVEYIRRFIREQYTISVDELIEEDETLELDEEVENENH